MLARSIFPGFTSAKISSYDKIHKGNDIRVLKSWSKQLKVIKRTSFAIATLHTFRVKGNYAESYLFYHGLSRLCRPSMIERLTISAHLQPCRLRMREGVVRSSEPFNSRLRCSNHFRIRSAADESLMKVTNCRPILQITRSQRRCPILLTSVLVALKCAWPGPVS